MKTKQPSLAKTVSQNIRSARLEAGLTQKELADKAGFQVSYVARLETTSQNLSLEVVEKICLALAKTPSELVNTNRASRVSTHKSKIFFNAMKLLRSFESQLKGKNW